MAALEQNHLAHRNRPARRNGLGARSFRRQLCKTALLPPFPEKGVYVVEEGSKPRSTCASGGAMAIIFPATIRSCHASE
eukprot:6192783-Pleurochrysis_carterae.AAC.6